jgi:HEAT repeat protein
MDDERQVLMGPNAGDSHSEHKHQIGPLMIMLRDGSSDNPSRGQFPTRLQAVAGLVALGDVAVEPLCQALRDDDGYTRRFAAEALSRIGDGRAVEPLIRAFRESEVYVQRHVSYALAKMGDARAVGPLYTALGKPKVAREALSALQGVLRRRAGTVSIDDLRRVASLADEGLAVTEVPDTDGGYLAWNEVEVGLDYRPLKQLARHELARRGLTG